MLSQAREGWVCCDPALRPLNQHGHNPASETRLLGERIFQLKQLKDLRAARKSLSSHSALGLFCRHSTGKSPYSLT